ncbi:FAD-dependent oxidoreductase [Massilia sp. GER05]|uniref:FAD-dependent oxidoreductase n=1 Tax=Massilia sp. GER05 TaxID=3394605 RepID=UPI003F87BE4D
MLNHLFSSIRLNRLELPNRILLSSMHLGYEGADQYERMARFYARRAKDGPGLIVTAGCGPDVAGRAAAEGFSLDHDSQIKQHRLITEAVHRAGDSKIALQLLHFGRESSHGRLVAPSALRLPGNIFTPTALTHENVIETINSYGSAARRAVEAGYDAIELLFSQGFLIHQFLSLNTNLRTDEWGGDRDSRMRFAVCVAAAVREAVGPDFPIIFRIPCLDLLEDGLTLEDSMTLIRKLACYQIDLLNVSIGWHESRVPTLSNVVPQAGFAQAAAYVKRTFPELLTCVSNRINDLRHGEAMLIDGVADMVAMARPFLADADIVAKFRQQRYEDVNFCIACNQDCLDRILLGHEVGCSVNPEYGVMDDRAQVPPLRAKVAVVGGGLAGMVAAYYLRRRGAEVTLFERGHELGGQMRLAAKIPSKSEFGGTVRFYERALRQAGVDVVLLHEFGHADLNDSAWDHVVVATGTEPNFVTPSSQEANSVRVLSWYDVIDKNLPVAFPVVIYGGGGVACDIAKLLLRKPSRTAISEKYLRDHGVDRLTGELGSIPETLRSITIMQRSSKKIGYRIGRTTRWITIQELEASGVEMLRATELARISDDGVVVTNKGRSRTIPAKTLIMATGQHARTETLREALTRAAIAFTIIGAASPCQREPASISSSIRSGYACAMSMSIGSAPIVAEQADMAV